MGGSFQFYGKPVTLDRLTLTLTLTLTLASTHTLNADGICDNVLGLRVFAVGHLGFVFFVGECCCQFEYSHKTIPLVGEDHFKPTTKNSSNLIEDSYSFQY